MLEYSDGTKMYFSFRNRLPKRNGHGELVLLEMPSASALFTSRYIDVTVIVFVVAALFEHTHKNLVAEIAFCVQAIHLVAKIMIVWRSAVIRPPASLVANPARTTLQSEHTGYLASVSVAVGAMADGAGTLGSVLCMGLLILVCWAMIVSRPYPRDRAIES